MNKAKVRKVYDSSTLLQRCTSFYQPIFCNLFGFRPPELTAETLSDLTDRLSQGAYQLNLSDTETYSDEDYNTFVLYVYICKNLLKRAIKCLDDDSAVIPFKNEPDSYEKLTKYLDYFKDEYGAFEFIDGYKSGVPLADIFA